MRSLKFRANAMRALHFFPRGRRLFALLLLMVPYCAEPADFPAPAQKSAQAPSVPAKISPRAQELLDRAIQALGGPAFLNFKRMSTAGRIFSITDEATAGLAPFESAVDFPDKRRLTLGKSGKKPVTLINNGERAWELDQFGTTHQLPEQIRRFRLSTQYGLENLLRLRIHAPDILIQDGGVDFVDNVPTWVVNIIEPEGGETKLFLNKQNYLPVRISYRARNPKTREWDEFADVYGDYQNIQGVMTPMHIARFLNDERISEVFRRTARYDEHYPADYFQPAG